MSEMQSYLPVNSKGTEGAMSTRASNAIRAVRGPGVPAFDDAPVCRGGGPCCATSVDPRVGPRFCLRWEDRRNFVLLLLTWSGICS